MWGSSPRAINPSHTKHLSPTTWDGRRKPTASAVGKLTNDPIPLCRRLARRECSDRSAHNKFPISIRVIRRVAHNCLPLAIVGSLTNHIPKMGKIRHLRNLKPPLNLSFSLDFRVPSKLENYAGEPTTDHRQPTTSSRSAMEYRTCTYIRDDGNICNSAAVTDRNLCLYHLDHRARHHAHGPIPRPRPAFLSPASAARIHARRTIGAHSTLRGTRRRHDRTQARRPPHSRAQHCFPQPAQGRQVACQSLSLRPARSRCRSRRQLRPPR